MSHFHYSSLQHTRDDTKNIVAEPSSQPQSDVRLFGAPLSNAGHWTKPAGHEFMEVPKPARPRRRPSRNDLVKHRRTRNGCYTCRSRRVKVNYPGPVPCSGSCPIDKLHVSAMRYVLSVNVRSALLSSRSADQLIVDIMDRVCERQKRVHLPGTPREPENFWGFK